MMNSKDMKIGQRRYYIVFSIALASLTCHNFHVSCTTTDHNHNQHFTATANHPIHEHELIHVGNTKKNHHQQDHHRVFPSKDRRRDSASKGTDLTSHRDHDDGNAIDYDDNLDRCKTREKVSKDAVLESSPSLTTSSTEMIYPPPPYTTTTTTTTTNTASNTKSNHGYYEDQEPPSNHNNDDTLCDGGHQKHAEDKQQESNYETIPLSSRPNVAVLEKSHDRSKLRRCPLRSQLSPPHNGTNGNSRSSTSSSSSTRKNYSSGNSRCHRRTRRSVLSQNNRNWRSVRSVSRTKERPYSSSSSASSIYPSLGNRIRNRRCKNSYYSSTSPGESSSSSSPPTTTATSTQVDGKDEAAGYKSRRHHHSALLNSIHNGGATMTSSSSPPTTESSESSSTSSSSSSNDSTTLKKIGGILVSSSTTSPPPPSIRRRNPLLLERRGNNNPNNTPNDKSSSASSSSTTTSSTPTHDNDMNTTPPGNNNKGNPVVYRYFGRSRARSIRSDSIPFIILGPRVDHWKIVGRTLANRGFNVMACERVLSDEEQNRNRWSMTNNKASSSSHTNKHSDVYEEGDESINDGEALITAVLDALKWNRAILVGCDRESVTAMEAALRLAPERVAGLVLCGDLTLLKDHVDKQISSIKHHTEDFDDAEVGDLTVDSFLRDYVDCPCSIIWDGDVSAWSTATRGGASSTSTADESGEEVGIGRSVIIGGGSAPYRRLPEQFAWTLSRFVENQVSEQSPAEDFMHYSMQDMDHPLLDQDDSEVEMEGGHTRQISNDKNEGRSWTTNVFSSVTNRLFGNTFSSGSLLVSGRAVASAIIYISLAKVGLFQYKNFRNIQSSYLNLTSWEKQIERFFGKVGTLSGRFFTASLPTQIHNRLRKRKLLSEEESSASIDSEPAECDDDTPPELEKRDDEGRREKRREKTRPVPEEEEIDEDADLSDEELEDEKSPDSDTFHNFFFLDQVVS